MFNVVFSALSTCRPELFGLSLYVQSVPLAVREFEIVERRGIDCFAMYMCNTHVHVHNMSLDSKPHAFDGIRCLRLGLLGLGAVFLICVNVHISA